MKIFKILKATFTTNPRLVIRTAKHEDVEPYLDAVKRVWPEEMWVDPEKVHTRIRTNPGGQLVVLVDGQFWGMATSIQLDDYDYDNPPSWYDITAQGWCTNHVPGGRTFFGVDLTVLPNAPKGTFDALMVAMGQLAVARGAECFLLGERLPDYHTYAATMTPEEYIAAKDESGRHLDRQIGMYQKVPGLKIVKVIPNYIDDPASLDNGLLLRWQNPFRKLPFPKVWAAIFGRLYRLESAIQASA